MSDQFRVERQALDGVQSVSVSGELDQATAPALREALEEAVAGSGGVLVDLSGCGFIDSSGLSLLVETQRRLAEGGRRFAVCSPRSEVRRLLELTGIDAAVGVFETCDEATAALSGSGAAS
jgi:anti-sigma B factor antagonist